MNPFAERRQSFALTEPLFKVILYGLNVVICRRLKCFYA